MAEQRRRWDRFEVMIEVRITTVVHGEQKTYNGQVCDLSKGGLRLLMTQWLEPGTNLQLEFLLPYHSAELSLRGVVRSRNGFSHGVEFVAPTGQEQKVIERTCDVFALLQ